MHTGFYSASYTMLNTVSDGWYEVTLQNPFFYDPSLSLVFEISVSSGTGNAVRQVTTSGVNQRRWGLHSATSGSTGTSLVNMGFDLIPGGTDVSLEGFESMSDTLCEGFHPVTVLLKNNGPNQLMTVDIEWEVNNAPQTTYNWSGNLKVDSMIPVVIGDYYFTPGTYHSIIANVTNPNTATDTINHNDTITKSEIYVLPQPYVSLNDSLIFICQGDSVEIGATLFGTPPWDLIINDGTNDYNVQNITDSLFTMTFTPNSTRLYNFYSITDQTGCENYPNMGVQVVVYQAPPATITTSGTGEACQGDSITLIGSIGLNFSYQWYQDGVILQGDTNYVYFAKTSGDYAVEVFSPIGCSNISQPYSVVIFPLPEVFLGNDTNIAPEASLTLDAGPGFQSYDWSTGETSQTITIDSSGIGLGTKTVWVEVTDNNDCVGTDTIEVTFVHNPGIAKTMKNADIKIFPNPSSGYTEILAKGFNPGEINIKVYSSDGRLVSKKTGYVCSDEEVFYIDLSNYSQGLYLLTIENNEVLLNKKIMVAK